jgi:hypothetical protein
VHIVKKNPIIGLLSCNFGVYKGNYFGVNVMNDYENRDVTGLYWTKNTLVGKIKVTTEPTPLRVGSENLAGRRQLWVVNDSSTFIYHSSDPNFSFEKGNYVFNIPAEIIVYDLDPNEDLTIYAKTKEYPVTIRVFEVI